MNLVHTIIRAAYPRWAQNLQCNGGIIIETGYIVLIAFGQFNARIIKGVIPYPVRISLALIDGICPA